MNSTLKQYITKLSCAFGLILNDMPDNRDDTVNEKLLDVLKATLTHNDCQEVATFLRAFLQDQVLKVNEDNSNSLWEKDEEVAVFFVRLLTIYASARLDVDRSFLHQVLLFIERYFANQFDSAFQTDSALCCAILNLLEQVYIDDSVADNNASLYHDVLLDKYLFSEKSISAFLGIHCKSLFVRKAYFLLAKRHIVHLLATKSDDENAQRIGYVTHAIARMPMGVKLFNFELFSEIFRYFVFGSDPISLDIVTKLKAFYAQLHCSDEHELFDELQHLTNDTSIEAFVYMLAFGFLFSPHGSDMQHLDAQLTRLCDRFIVRGQCKRSIDLIFKCLIYYYAFCDDVTRSPFAAGTIGLDSIKDNIARLLLLPLTLRFNKSECAPHAYDNYLRHIATEPCKYKQLLVRQCLVNLRLFMRKFTAVNTRLPLFRHVTVKHIIYLLRHFEVDVTIKNLLLSFLQEFFVRESESECLSELSHVFVNEFDLSLDGAFNSNMLQLIAINDVVFGDVMDDASQSLCRHISRIRPHLKQCLQGFKTASDETVLEDFIALCRFLTAQVGRRSPFCIQLLHRDDDCVLNSLTDVARTQKLDDTFINELKDEVFLFLQSLFATVSASPQFQSLVLEDLVVYEVESQYFTQSEAFHRRELVHFLQIYYVYMAQTAFTPENIFSAFQFFAWLLVNDFDWQVQLYALKYFQCILPTSYLNANNEQSKYTVFQSACCFSDCFTSLTKVLKDSDQHVVNGAARLLLELKTNAQFVTVMKETLQLVRTDIAMDESRQFFHKFIRHAEKYAENVEKSMPGHALEHLLDTLQVKNLQDVIHESEQTSDIYVRNPISLLDDIISSYQFDMDDDKTIDCY